MPSTTSSHRATPGETIVYINLWADSGMKHYSESLVAALVPACEVYYVRNYESLVATTGRRVALAPLSLRGWGELWDLGRDLIRRKPLAIHINSELPVLLPLFPLLACFNTVITLHDALPHEGERLAKRLFMRLHLWLLFLFIGKIIVHAESIRAELPAYLRSRVRILPHVNYRLWARDKAAADVRDELDGAGGAGPLRVLFFGRLLRYKGLEYLLQAFRELDPRRFELTIAGHGDLSGYDLEQPHVRVINRFIEEPEMAELFNATQVVALPYISASQSGVAYMAFAFDKPVIATRVGGIGDVVRDGVNGLLVEPCCAAALVAALERVADAPTRARLVEQVRSEQLSADEEIRAKLLAIYRE